MNKCILTGRIASDIETRTTQSGNTQAQFRLAVRRKFANQQGEHESDFIGIVCWRNTADFVAKYFQKGSMCLVEGSIQTRTYEKDGQKRYVTEVIADNVEFCGSKGDSVQGTQNAPQRQQSKPQGGGTTDKAKQVFGDAVEYNDDLPFD